MPIKADPTSSAKTSFSRQERKEENIYAVKKCFTQPNKVDERIWDGGSFRKERVRVGLGLG